MGIYFFNLIYTQELSQMPQSCSKLFISFLSLILDNPHGNLLQECAVKLSHPFPFRIHLIMGFNEYLTNTLWNCPQSYFRAYLYDWLKMLWRNRCQMPQRFLRKNDNLLRNFSICLHLRVQQRQMIVLEFLQMQQRCKHFRLIFNSRLIMFNFIMMRLMRMFFQLLLCFIQMLFIRLFYSFNSKNICEDDGCASICNLLIQQHQLKMPNDQYMHANYKYNNFTSMSHHRLNSKALRLKMEHLIRSSHNSPQARDSIKKYVFGMKIDSKFKKKEANMWQQNSDDAGVLLFNDYSINQKTTIEKVQDIPQTYKDESVKQQRNSSRVHIDLPDMSLIHKALKHASKKNRTQPSELLKSSAIKYNKLTDLKSTQKQMERANTFLFSSPTKPSIRPSLPKLKEEIPKDDLAMLAVLNRIQGTKITRPSNFRMDKDKLSSALIDRFGFEHFTDYYNLEASEPFPSISLIVESFLSGSYKNQLQFIFATYDLNKDGTICQEDIWNLINIGSDAVLSDVTTIGDFLSKNRIGSKPKLQKEQTERDRKSLRTTNKNKSVLSKKNRIKQFFSTQITKEDTQRSKNDHSEPMLKQFRISFEIFRLIFSDHASSLLKQYISFFTKQCLPSSIPQCKTISIKPAQIQSTRCVQVRQTIAYLSQARHQRKYLKECNVKF